MKSKIILSTLFFIVGLFSGAHFFSKTIRVKEFQNISASTSNEGINLKKLERSIQKLTDDDLIEYAQLTEMKAKYEKADEILGKIMVLFLANIHLEINKNVKDYFVHNKRPKLKTLPSHPLSETTNLKKTNIGPEVITDPFKDWDKSHFNKIESEEFEIVEIKTSKFELKNPYQFFKSAKDAKSIKELGLISGKFEGDLYITKGKNKGKIDKVVLDINFHQERNKLIGQYFVEISRDGKPYSTNRGSGDNGQAKIVKKPKRHYLLEASPNSFFQVFPESSRNNQSNLFGKFYDDDEYIGLVKLYRME